MAETKTYIGWPRITLFGDSITFPYGSDPDNGCWTNLIGHKCGAYFDVNVRGFSGYNTRFVKRLLERQFPTKYLKEVELLVFFFGHNDSWQHGAIGVPIEEFEQNLHFIFNHFKTNGLGNLSEKLLLITPTWYDKQGADGIFGEDFGKTASHASKYSDVVLKVATELQLDCLDFYEVSLNYPKLGELFIDGVHLSRVGSQLLFDNLWPLMETKIKKRYGASMDELRQELAYYELPELAEFSEEMHKQTVSRSKERQRQQSIK